MDERLRFVARLLEREAMSDVCRAFGISRQTGYKIFNRYKGCGLEALSDRSRRPVRDAASNAADAIPTFGRCADDLIAEREQRWRNDKHKAQWRMTLDVYAAPLRDKPVDKTDTAAVLAVLKPIWLERPETASRLRGHVEAVLDAARVLGRRSENEARPARWRGRLVKLLTARKTLTRGHHAAMPYEKSRPSSPASLHQAALAA